MSVVVVVYVRGVWCVVPRNRKRGETMVCDVL